MVWYVIFQDESVDSIASLMKIIKDVDWDLKALENLYRGHGAAVEGITDWLEDVISKWSVKSLSEATSRYH